MAENMTALNRKTIRDLMQMKGQAAAIAMVIACGEATFVMSLSVLQSLIYTQHTYYDRYRFADVFAQLKRAPKALEARLSEISGVAEVQTRVVVDVNLLVPGMEEPAVGRLISVPRGGVMNLNSVYLKAGRLIDPERSGEAMVSESFALAHNLFLGDQVAAIINGRHDTLTIVGLTLSPEYVYQIRPGEILPDDRRFGVLWMSEVDLAPAFNMDGAFNDVALTLAPGAVEAEVITRVDALLARYGSLGAYGRSDHTSHRFIENEINELQGMSLIVPTIFLSVAAFLLNVVISRVVSAQREQIAALKAFGYFQREIGRHYLKLVLLIAIGGASLGALVGAWLGHGLTQMYTQFFHFPIFHFRLDLWVIALALVISCAAAIGGTMFALRRAASLPPAEAMRPEPPAMYRPTFIERLGLQRLFSPAARMILRQLERRPVKSCFTCLGIAMAAAVLVLGSFMLDAINYVMHLNFEVSQRQTMTVNFVEPRSHRAINELRSMPGVMDAEPFRSLAVRLTAGHLSRRVGVLGLPAQRQMFRLIDLQGERANVPAHGILLSTKLAELLRVKVGDSIVMEVLQESKPIREVQVAGTIDDFAGTSAYMSDRAVNRLMREQNTVSGAYLRVDPIAQAAVYQELKNTPQVAGVTVTASALESFQRTVAENILRMRSFNIGFACIIAFGVVYNSMRISLAERSRDLATLRVIGFTRGEISMILLGELAVLTFVAIPIGLVIGYGFAALTSMAYNTELFRIPLIVNHSTFAFAAITVLIAATISGYIVRRRIDHLDLVAVLKTRE